MNKPIEDWMLTAYALGELEGSDQIAVEDALKNDPALQSELAEIRSTLQTVSSALQTTAPKSLPLATSNAIRQSIEVAASKHHANQSVLLAGRENRKQLRKFLWAGLATVAASGAVAVAWGPSWLNRDNGIALAPVDDSKLVDELKSETVNPEWALGETSSLGTAPDKDTSDRAMARYSNGEEVVAAGRTVEENRFGKNAELKQQLDEQVEDQKSEVEQLNRQLAAHTDQLAEEAPARYEEIVDEIREEVKLRNRADASASADDYAALGDEPATQLSDLNASLAYDAPAKEKADQKVDALGLQVQPKPSLNAPVDNSKSMAVEFDASNGQVTATAGDPWLDGAQPQSDSEVAAGVEVQSGRGLAAGQKPNRDAYGLAAGGLGGYGGGYGGGPGVGGPGGGGRGGYGAAGGPGSGYGPAGPFVVESSKSEGAPSSIADETSYTVNPNGPASGEVFFAEGEVLQQVEAKKAFETTETELAKDSRRGRESAFRYYFRQGQGRHWSEHDPVAGDRFEHIELNRFQSTAQQQLTTFSIDVDTAAYSKIRQSMLEASSLPNPNAVRIEEMINYFTYDYAGPEGETPFAAQLAAADCPWASGHKLVRIALQAKKLQNESRPLSNLVFLLDVSGSMDEPNKLPLVKKSISMLARQLGENDRVAIVVYAGAAGVVLPSTNGNNQAAIMSALDDLQAGGSTNGSGGIQLAYQIASEHFIKGGLNRIVLCTDGDFNVGTTGDDDLVSLVERNAKDKQVFLTCLGFGMGNYNDSMMEKITNKGNGNYAMIDTELEARKVMVEQISSTLVTVAKDVKVQVEFNPQHVAAYRLIGYENRKLANRDFKDDTKDAGEIGAGHSVTALYEIVPVGMVVPQPNADAEPLRYAKPAEEPVAEELDVKQAPIDPALANELLTVKLRYKKPDGNVSSELEFPMQLSAYEQPVDADFRWAASVAEFGMLLRNPRDTSQSQWDKVIETSMMSAKSDAYRLEAIELMRRASSLSRQ
jgi:Ca-activated chloride channel homolog